MTNLRQLKKILIIRFSSFGDIVQALSVVNSIKSNFKDAQIHWLTKKSFASIVAIHPEIHQILSYDSQSGIRGLWRLSKEVHSQNYDMIYDAHSVLRTSFFFIFLKLHSFMAKKSFPLYLKRPKNRWKRFLYFKLQKRDVFPSPFKGMESFHWPLAPIGITWRGMIPSQWNFTDEMLRALSEKYLYKILPNERFLTLAPSAAWAMKRWPLSHWKKLIELLPDYQMIILGGPEDEFCKDLQSVAPLRLINTAGSTSLLESCCLVFLSDLVISADTGILHVADLFEVKAIGLLGPTAFGFPSGDTVEVMEIPLSCRPCTKDGRGNCSQTVYQKCMVDITPEQVAMRIRQVLEPR